MDTEVKLKDSMGLETLDKKGKAPSKRLDDAGAASNIVQDMLYAAQIRAGMKAKAQGQRDGNPPYDSKKRRANGQAHLTNVNTMECDAFVSQAVTPFYDLFGSTKYPIQPVIEFGNEKDASVWESIMGEGLERMIKKWPAWHNQWWPGLNEFIYHGRCFFMWPNDESWMFKRISEDKVLFPDNCPVDHEDWEIFVTLQDIPAYKIWEPLADGEAPHWNKDNVIAAIRNAFPKNLTGQEPMDTQRFVNEKSFLFTMSRSVFVQIANIFVREWSGKWSHLIILQPCSETYQNANGGKELKFDSEKNSLPPYSQFLYEHYDKYDSVENCMTSFIFDTTHSTINECYGMAKKTFSMFALADRLFCSHADGAFMRSGLTVQTSTEEGLTKAKMIRLGSLNVIPPGVSIQQSTIMTDMDAAMKSRNEIGTILQGNTGIYRPQVENKPGNPRTAAEYVGEAQKAQVLANSAVDRFYSQLDVHFTEMVRRIVICSKKKLSGQCYELARDWRKYCIDRGVPEEVFDHVERAEALRTTGNGSMYMRQQIMQALLAVMQRLPEDGQELVIEDYVAAFAGQSKVERYDSRVSRRQLPTQDHDIAMLENAALKIGAPVTWEPTQNDVIHAQVHIQSATEAIQVVQQGADPKEVHAFVDRIGAHVVTHIQNLSKDPSRKDVVKLLSEQVKQLGKVNDELGKHIENQQKQQREVQQQQQEVDAKTQLKAFETKAKVQLAAQKTQEMMRMKREQHQQKMAIADAEAGAGIRRQLLAFQSKPKNN